MEKIIQTKLPGRSFMRLFRSFELIKKRNNDGRRFTTATVRRLVDICLLLNLAWNERFLRIKQNLDREYRWIAVRRSSVLSHFHYRPRLFPVSDDVGHAVAVCDHKSHMFRCGHCLTRVEAQSSLLDSPVIVVRRDSLTSRHAAERYRCNVSEHGNRQSCQMLQHYLPLQPLRRYISYILNPWQ